MALRCYHYTFVVLRHGFNGQLSSCQSYSYICRHIRPIWPPVISMGQWSIRRIFLIMPRMKCRCPYSASAMIGHAPSVERLYPTVGKHELQGSVCEASLPKFGFGHERGRRFPELRGHFHRQIVVLSRGFKFGLAALPLQFPRASTCHSIA